MPPELVCIPEDLKEEDFVKNLKKTLDKRGLVSFIIMVAWLVAGAGKIKGKLFLLFSSFIFEPDSSLSFTLAESHSQV